MPGFILLLVSVILGAGGQFLFKLGMKSFGELSISGVFHQLISIILTPSISGGFILFGLSSVLWLSVISRYQLSYAYPMVSLGYVVTIILSGLFLNEQLNIYRIIGASLIISGVLFVSKS